MEIVEKAVGVTHRLERSNLPDSAKIRRGYRFAGLAASVWVVALVIPTIASPALAQEEGPDEDEPVARSGFSSMEVRSPRGTRELRNALERLSQNSRSVDALVDAGNAALLLRDSQAALGFFARADQIDPRNARVKSGLASAVLGTGNPYEALRLFQQAIGLGTVDSFVAGDRGLAFDLVGDPASAQRDYQIALKRSNDDEIKRRYALSLGISGERSKAEQLLTPMLQQGDGAAWRIRTFVLAIDGDFDGAVAIARGTMSDSMVQKLVPFLRYMPKLTPAQQAAAAHFGYFPPADDIGKDDPRNAQWASAGRSGRADAGLIPIGEPFGPRADAASAKPKPKVSKKGRRRPGRSDEPASAPTRVAANSAATPPVSIPTPTPSPAPPPTPTPTPPPAAVPAPPPASAPVQTAEASPAASPNGPVQGPFLPGFESLGSTNTRTDDAAEASGFDLARATTPASSQSPPASSPSASVAANAVRPGFAELMSDIYVPPTEERADPDAVDISTIEPARPEPKAEPKPPEPAKPKHPSRHWVQVAGGANADALPREWKRLADIAPAAFRGQDAWTTPLRFTNRLLAGPFDSDDAAQEFVNELAKSDLAAFSWTSPEGQEITSLKIR